MSENPIDTAELRYSPAWSPDGRQIAFTLPRGDNQDIYIIDASGKNERRLTTHPRDDGHPTWSPDGTQIVFESNRNQERLDLYRITLASGEIERLTGVGADIHPDWCCVAHKPTPVHAVNRKWCLWGQLKTGSPSEPDE